MDTGTQHVVSLLRSLADDIEHGLSVYFEVKTDAGAYEQRPLGLTAEQRAFQRFEMKIEINPNAPRRCPFCRTALGPQGTCVTVQCPQDAVDPGPFTWYLDEDNVRRHALPCGGNLIADNEDGDLHCSKCGEYSR